MREAEGAFGDASIYLEQAVVRARHIEVQVLADAAGDVVHLFERDCSVQRRYQKVIELAPAPNLDPALRDALCDDAVRFAREIGYVNAGTVEFLVDGECGEYVFIEMNPRIQVEHTVTEETTDVDLVRSQLLIAAGAQLKDLGLRQDTLRQRGFALQCRITTENPAEGFRPDTGRISAYRAPGGAGIRLDEGSAYVGAEVSPYYDSLLLKVTARAHDFATAIARARRAVDEVRVRGVSTNQAFLSALLDDPDFQAGRTYTTFVDEHPSLSRVGGRGDRGSKLLRRLAEVTVNRSYGSTPPSPDPRTKLPRAPPGDPPPGSRQRLLELGPQRFASWLRAEPALGLTDTTLRDAHQSLLATRMRTFDMLAVAPHIAHGLPELLSLEVWGGATFDVALRFLSEDPWERLAALRERIPNVCLQMLLRGRNLLGYAPYPDAVVRAFVAEASATGVDIFRIFDALNNAEPMRTAIDATLESGAVEEAPSATRVTCRIRASASTRSTTTCASPSNWSTWGRTCSRSRTWPASCARRLHACWFEPAQGVRPARPPAHPRHCRRLAGDVPRRGRGRGRCRRRRRRAAGRDDQPAVDGGIVAASDQASGRPGSRSTRCSSSSRTGRTCARSTLRSRLGCARRRAASIATRSRVDSSPTSASRRSASASATASKRSSAPTSERIRCSGDIVKVTPTSKVVGDLALFVVSGGIDWDELEKHPEKFDLPDSVLDFLRGELGRPAAGLPEPFASRALRDAGGREAGAAGAVGRPRQARASPGRIALARLMYPAPFRDFEESQERYGDVSVLPTRAFFYGLRPGIEEEIELEPGVRLMIELEAVGDPDERGMRTVLSRLNGQLRPLDVRDRSIDVGARRIERADPKNSNTSRRRWQAS